MYSIIHRVKMFLDFLKYVDKSKLWIVPLAKNSKRPLNGYKWKEQRISIKEAVDYLLKGYNIAFVAKKDGLCFIDVDDPRLLIKVNMPQTLTVKTPHGYHYYFYNEGLESNVLLRGIEFRLHDMYVVGVGSCVDRKTYRVIYHTKPVSIYEMPLWKNIAISSKS